MPLEQSRWIWLPQEQIQENQWINLRRIFKLDALVTEALLHLAVDTDYVVWINGQFAGTRAFSDFPQERHYDSLEIGRLLQPGENTLAILAWHQGKDTSRHRKGEPGLIFELEAGEFRLVSDKNCRVRQSPSYLSGPVPLVTPQLGLTITCDGRGEDGWKLPGHEDKAWSQARELAGATDGYWRSLQPSPIKKLQILERTPVTIVAEGSFRKGKSGGSAAAEIAGAELLPDHTQSKQLWGDTVIFPSEHDGRYLILDLGRETFGYLELELTAPAGARVDIGHGEHLLDGRTRCNIGPMNYDLRGNYADRYICREGRQHWLMPMRGLGCRYLELHLSNFSGPVTLHYAGLRPLEYPLARVGDFRCDDELYNRIFDVSIRTLTLCMHEHYEDCIWREQCLYSMDARNQALCGYYSFGEYDFPAVSYTLLGKTRQWRQDNLLDLCAPADIPITIPGFAMLWMVAIRDHLLYSGQTSLVENFWGQIQEMLDSYLARRDRDGLLRPWPGTEYWNFYEWSAGLDENGPFMATADGQIQSCLNLFLLEAVEAVAQIAQFTTRAPDATRYKIEADKLRQAIREKLAIGPDHMVPLHVGGDQTPVWSQLPQALALITGVLPSGQASSLRQRLVQDQSLTPATLSMTLYFYEALLQDREKFGQTVLDHISATWGFMLQEGATSCWETIKGAADFGGSGSLCHGWSAVPSYIYQSYILGIRPLEPGFRRFAVNPLPGRLERAQGIIPTPQGNIAVEWHKTGDRYLLRLHHPKNLQAVFELDQDIWKIISSSQR